MNIFVGLIYVDLDFNNTLQVSKTLFLLALGIFFQSMNPQVITFSQEREVFLKEESAHMYHSFAYFVAKCIPEIIICFYFGLQVGIIEFWMIGFNGGADKFFFFCLLYALVSNVGNAVGVMISNLYDSAKVASSFA